MNSHMKYSLIVLVLATLAETSSAQHSAFATVRYGDAVQVELPRNWTYMDSAVASHLNTSSEAVAKVVGLTLPQGNNVVLVAANAHDSAGKSKATLRVSMRTEPGLTQAQMRELVRSSPAEIEAMLRPSADETVKAMLQMQGVKSYRVTELRLDTSGALTCSLSRFEGDYGGRLMVSDTYVCPAAARTIKLSISYEKALASIYAPTLANVRRTLSIPTSR